MKMTQKERFGVISILSMSFMPGLGFGCAFSTFYMDVEPPSIETGAWRTSITAAHLGEVDGYMQVYVDEDTDFAIHVKEEYTAEGLFLSDVVPLAGTTGIVSSVSRQEFFAVVDGISKIVSGVSGEPVYLNNAPIGFISGWDGRGSLRCTFYQEVPTWASLLWSLSS